MAPDRDYRLVDGSGRTTSQGRLYLYDAANERIVGFDKVDGGYLAGWQPADREMADVRDMYVVEGSIYKKGFRRKNDTLVWITPEGIYEAKPKVPEPT